MSAATKRERDLEAEEEDLNGRLKGLRGEGHHDIEDLLNNEEADPNNS